MRSISLSEFLQEQEDAFNFEVARYSNPLIIDYGDKTISLDIEIHFDRCLYKYKRVGGFAWTYVNDKKFGASCDIEFDEGKFIDYKNIVSCIFATLLRKINKELEHNQVCKTCNGQGWYVDFMNRKKCEDCNETR
jgi:hypothetical protein